MRLRPRVLADPQGLLKGLPGREPGGCQKKGFGNQLGVSFYRRHILNCSFLGGNQLGVSFYRARTPQIAGFPFGCSVLRHNQKENPQLGGGVSSVKKTHPVGPAIWGKRWPFGVLLNHTKRYPTRYAQPYGYVSKHRTSNKNCGAPFHLPLSQDEKDAEPQKNTYHRVGPAKAEKENKSKRGEHVPRVESKMRHQ